MKKNCAFFGTNNLIAPKNLLNKLFAQSLSALYQWRPRSDEKGGGEGREKGESWPKYDIAVPKNVPNGNFLHFRKVSKN